MSLTPDQEALLALGRFLTGTQARDIAARVDARNTLTQALQCVGAGQRSHLRELLTTAGLTIDDRPRLVAVLRGIEGAHSVATAARPLWTMPGHLASEGRLTGSLAEVIERARTSVTCSTYNFQRSSQMWQALRDAAARPGIDLRVYVDAEAGGPHRSSWAPSCEEMAGQLAPAPVLRTTSFDGAPVRNHAKFVAVDHRFLLVTSANFSASAELRNVELGVWLDDPVLTDSVERQMRAAEEHIYERVAPG